MIFVLLGVFWVNLVSSIDGTQFAIDLMQRYVINIGECSWSFVYWNRKRLDNPYGFREGIYKRFRRPLTEIRPEMTTRHWKTRIDRFCHSDSRTHMLRGPLCSNEFVECQWLYIRHDLPSVVTSTIYIKSHQCHHVSSSLWNIPTTLSLLLFLDLKNPAHSNDIMWNIPVNLRVAASYSSVQGHVCASKIY